MSKSINDCIKNRENNLDMIRTLAASLVVFSHAFPLVNGNNTNEPLNYLIGQSTLGGLAVAIFFIISGFLISQSFEKSNNLFDYSLARILRIFPGLIICFIFTVFFIGPLATNLSLIDYFTSFQTYNYFIGITSLNFFSPHLPGVFVDNPYPLAVNGSLWTIKYELICYFLVAIMGILGFLKNKKIVITLFVICIIFSFFKLNEHLNNFFKLSSLFLSGSIFYLYRTNIHITYKYLILSIIILMVFTYFGLFNLGLNIFGTYIIIFLSFINGKFKNFSKNGDLSYGIYIYAFPIQQCIVNFSNNRLNIIEHTILSLLIVVFISYISWHYIEKPALNLRKKITFSKLL